VDVQVLVDSGEFWDRLREDFEGARQTAFVQTFTFEGDRVGTMLARALERCTATDRRFLVDGYSLLYHSDRLIVSQAWLDRDFRREVFLTHSWVRHLRRNGFGVRFSNPVGPSPMRLVRRNHKKLVVVDGVVYLGGMNFSEHNFAWHDMMLRVESPRLAGILAEDFDASWEGRSRPMDRMVDPFRLLSLNGRGNARGLAPVLEALAGSRRSIDVQSAYLSHPFTRHLADARARGVRVRVLTPANNNKGNLARHIRHTAYRHDFEVYARAGMSHLKAMLIDDELLVTGSSNFDFMSYHIFEELIVMTRDPSIVDAYRRRVWEPDLRRAERIRPRPDFGTRLGHAAVRLGARMAEFLALP